MYFERCVTFKQALANKAQPEEPSFSDHSGRGSNQLLAILQPFPYLCIETFELKETQECWSGRLFLELHSSGFTGFNIDSYQDKHDIDMVFKGQINVSIS
jgi:hypothetical protein